MKNSLKMIELILQDIFLSIFMKTMYKIVAGIFVCWALFIPSVKVLDFYRGKPLLKYIPNEENERLSIQVLDSHSIKVTIIANRDISKSILWSLDKSSGIMFLRSAWIGKNTNSISRHVNKILHPLRSRFSRLFQKTFFILSFKKIPLYIIVNSTAAAA